jgi:hypothetical protein
MNPETVFERSDVTLAGGQIAVRGATVPHDDGPHSLVAVTVRVPASSFQVVPSDGSVTATLVLSPGEALGIGAWLRDAAVAADQAGPPLYDWTPPSSGNAE